MVDEGAPEEGEGEAALDIWLCLKDQQLKQTDVRILNAYTVSGEYNAEKQAIHFTQTFFPPAESVSSSSGPPRPASAKTNATWSKSRDYSGTVSVAPHDDDPSQLSWKIEGTFLTRGTGKGKDESVGSFYLETSGPLEKSYMSGGIGRRRPPAVKVPEGETVWTEIPQPGFTEREPNPNVSIVFDEGKLGSTAAAAVKVDGTYTDMDPRTWYDFVATAADGVQRHYTGLIEYDGTTKALQAVAAQLGDVSSLRLRGVLVKTTPGSPPEFLGPCILKPVSAAAAASSEEDAAVAALAAKQAERKRRKAAEAALAAEKATFTTPNGTTRTIEPVGLSAEQVAAETAAREAEAARVQREKEDADAAAAAAEAARVAEAQRLALESESILAARAAAELALRQEAEARAREEERQRIERDREQVEQLAREMKARSEQAAQAAVQLAKQKSDLLRQGSAAGGSKLTTLNTTTGKPTTPAASPVPSATTGATGSTVFPLSPTTRQPTVSAADLAERARAESASIAAALEAQQAKEAQRLVDLERARLAQLKKAQLERQKAERAEFLAIAQRKHAALDALAAARRTEGRALRMLEITASKNELAAAQEEEDARAAVIAAEEHKRKVEAASQKEAQAQERLERLKLKRERVLKPTASITSMEEVQEQTRQIQLSRAGSATATGAAASAAAAAAAAAGKAAIAASRNEEAKESLPSAAVRNPSPPRRIAADLTKNYSEKGILAHIFDLLTVPPDYQSTSVLAIPPILAPAELPHTILFSPVGLPVATYFSSPKAGGHVQCVPWTKAGAREIFEAFEAPSLEASGGDVHGLAAVIFSLDGTLSPSAITLLELGQLLKNGLGTVKALDSFQSTSEGFILQRYTFAGGEAPDQRHTVYRCEFASGTFFECEKRVNKYVLFPQAKPGGSPSRQHQEVSLTQRVAAYKANPRDSTPEPVIMTEANRYTDSQAARDLFLLLRKTCVTILRRLNLKCEKEHVCVQRLTLYFHADIGGKVYLLFGDRLNLCLTQGQEKKGVASGKKTTEKAAAPTGHASHEAITTTPPSIYQSPVTPSRQLVFGQTEQ